MLSGRLIRIIAVCAVLAGFTVARLPVWRSDITLWSDAAAKAPTKVRTHINIGRQWDVAGELGLAEREYRAAVTMSFNPRYPEHRALEARCAAETNLAHLLMKRGDLASAMRLLDSVLAAWPSYPYAHFNRGFILRAAGACDLARLEFYQAVTPPYGDPALTLPSPLCLANP